MPIIILILAQVIIGLILALIYGLALLIIYYWMYLIPAAVIVGLIAARLLINHKKVQKIRGRTST